MKKNIFMTKIISFCLMLLASAFSLSAQQTTSLNGQWKLTYWPQGDDAITNPGEMASLKTETINATVPGNVELDLLAAGIIKEPSVGNNIYALRKYEGYQWCYERHFAAPSLAKGEHAIISFGGIDCMADVFLNGKKIGEAENTFIGYEFDVTKDLKSGDNLLQVVIRSAFMEAQKHLIGLYSFRHYTESVWIRKPRHCYGWDIMPRLVSAGLWRNVDLIVKSPVNITDVNWVTVEADAKTNKASGFVDVQFKAPFEMFDKMRVNVTLSRDGKKVFEKEEIVPTLAWRMEYNVDNAELWWPRSYGKAALYDAVVQLKDEKGNVLAVDKRKFGFRTIKLDRSEMNRDGKGKFCFIVNGEKIFCRGTNWVPLDGFHSRDAKWVDSTIAMCVDLNCNMIRCWGGNVYEDTRFFDLCDENGIMIWQDFAMAGIFYPQTEEFLSKIRKEITSVVLKFRSHPSIALWSGNNENDASLTWTLPSFKIDPNNDAISRKLIPEILYEFDPTRPYLPSSPYYSEEAYLNGCESNDLPENHLWGPRGYYKAPFYTQATSKFVSEIGYHGCPNKESLQKMFTPDAVYPWTKDGNWNDEWYTKSVRPHPYFIEFKGRNDLMTNQIKLLFGFRPTTLEDFIASSQSTQAEAMKYFVERFRGSKFDRTGILWWNVRDGWPIVSDAIVDYYNSKKLAYYFIKNAQYDICVLVNDPINGEYQLMAVNDTREAVTGKVKVSDIASGKELFKGDFKINANDRTLVAAIPELQGQGMLLIEYETGGKQLKNHYLYGTPPFKFTDYRKWLKKTGIYPVQ